MPSKVPSRDLLSMELCSSMESISLTYNLLASNGALIRNRLSNHCSSPCFATSTTTSGRNSIMFSKIAETKNSSKVVNNWENNQLIYSKPLEGLTIFYRNDQKSIIYESTLLKFCLENKQSLIYSKNLIHLEIFIRKNVPINYYFLTISNKQDIP